MVGDTMKNWEYYKDELEKVNYRFAILHNGTFVACEDVATCIDCEFCVAGINCGNEAIKFFKKIKLDLLSIY